jgi:5-methylthioadenosine/S-adenosylhomocysteine deaminase
MEKDMKFENCRILLPGRKTGYGDVTVENGKIAAIDLRDEPPAYECGKLLMPGLVNCHGHTAMTLLRGLGGGLPLQRWLEEAIFPVEAKMTAEDIRAGVVWGAMEMLAGGTSAVADMYDFPDAGGAAFEEIGMKANICRVGLNFVPGRLAECVKFVRDWKPDRVVSDVCIHSEYLTDEGFCRELAAANRELMRPLHVHISETKREHDECIARHGKTPLAYLADTGILDYGAYAAHCVWCTDDDFRIMRERNVTLVHNPTSNLKLGSGFARIPEAIAAGVNVALGTDGCASNDNLDMFEEMHLASLMHKGRLNDPTVMNAWDVIEMATVNGARALGMHDSGEIALGKAADLCLVDLDKPHLSPALSVPDLVVNSMHASDVVMTMVDGEILYDRGQWPTINHERAGYDFKCAVRKLFNIR